MECGVTILTIFASNNLLSMEIDITELFRTLIAQTGAIDVAEQEFKKMIGEDADLHKLYRDYCHEVGSSERRGFLDYADEYIDNQESVWDSLSDYDE